MLKAPVGSKSQGCEKEPGAEFQSERPAKNAGKMGSSWKPTTDYANQPAEKTGQADDCAQESLILMTIRCMAVTATSRTCAGDRRRSAAIFWAVFDLRPQVFERNLR